MFFGCLEMGTQDVEKIPTCGWCSVLQNKI
jgi:hypothetical protein